MMQKFFSLPIKFLFEKHQKIKYILSYLWVAIIFTYLLFFILKQPEKISQLISYSDFNNVILSLILIIFGKAVAAFLVYISLIGNSEKRSKFFAWQAYSYSDIAKYLPGGIWSIAGRLTIYHKDNIRLSTGSKILLAETTVLIFMFLFTGILLISIVSLTLPYVIIIAFTLLTISFFILKTCLPRLGLIMRYFVSFIVCLACLAFGLSFAILTYPLDFEWLWTVGQFNIAFVVGQLAIFAPSGIGVREIVAGYFPSIDNSININYFIQIAVFHRFIWIIADILFIFPLLFMSFLRNIKARLNRE